MTLRKNPLSVVLPVLHILLVTVGSYAILTLWEWVPTFKNLFGEDLTRLESFVKSILFIFFPIGIALFTNQMVFDNTFVGKILTFVGFALMVVPALVLHIQVLDAIANGSFLDFCNEGSHNKLNNYFGLALIFPLICLYLVTTFQLIGKDQYIIHEDYDDALNNVGFILPYCYACVGICAVTLFIGSLGSMEFYSIFSLFVAIIALAVMGISRLKNGSPFEY